MFHFGWDFAPAAEPREAVFDAPLPPVEAAQTMLVPEGFHVSLFAGEPEVRQPVGFCFDDRGRLWVAEAHNYPRHGTRPGDRILVFEDADGDGRFDTRTLFYDQLNYVTGIEVGFGGVWVVSPPYFYFLPDRDGDAQLDGSPEIVLDGLGNHANPHNLANALAWGPDGWLYGTHGRTNWSLIGKPGTPEAERIRFDGGVYRFHPVRRVWEAYADGTTNPWGIDWNDVGDAFVTNCVNPHLFHIIPGAHYEPWRNRDSSRYAYERIPTIADHLHFVGTGSVRAGLASAAEDAAGGGHAHCGVMIYQGDNWPDPYRNTLFTNNIHGHRINNDLLRRAGSGYAAAHGRDLLRARDPWFMGVTLQYGPDGGVFVIDWSDTGECHSYENTRRETGRIFKIWYGDLNSTPFDLARCSDQQLVAMHSHRNEWWTRHARRLLQERAARGHNLAAAVAPLRAALASNDDPPHRLRALWTLHAVGQLDEPALVKLLDDASEYLRGWAVKLLFDAGPPSAEVQRRLAVLAEQDSSPYVRLALASSLQRLPLSERWPIASALAQRAEDASDANLPLMLWYGIEPLADADLPRFATSVQAMRIPRVARFMARRAASHSDAASIWTILVSEAARAAPAVQDEYLAGLLDGLAGQRSAPMPANWRAAYYDLQASSSGRVRDLSQKLALVFDDPLAASQALATATDASAPPEARRAAIVALAAKRASALGPLLLALVADPAVQQSAIQALAEFDEAATAQRLIELYPALPSAARVDAVQTLASRRAWAATLLDATDAGIVPVADLSAFAARQVQSLGDQALTSRLERLWGTVRSTSSDKAQQIAGFRQVLTAEALGKADRSQGRLVFQRTCAHCHRFFDDGGAIGPNLTGSQRTNLDYLLQTIVDPSAAVARDYQMQIITTTAGRVLTGLVVDESPAALTVQTVNEKVVVPRVEIEERVASSQSMMPEGMLQALSSEQLRQLFGYLMGPDQPPLPAGPSAAESVPK